MQIQNQKQQQHQLQLLYRTLNGFLEALQELDGFETLPMNIKEASSYNISFLSVLDNCISQLNAPVVQVGSKEIYNANKTKLAISTLEWLSIRAKQIDIIDELCCIFLYNCLGIKKPVPERVQSWDGKVSQGELQEFAGLLVQSQHTLNEFTKRIETGEQPLFAWLDQARQEGNIIKGIERVYKFDEILARRLHKWLFDKELVENVNKEATIFDNLDEIVIIRSFILYEAYNELSRMRSKTEMLKWYEAMKELSKTIA